MVKEREVGKELEDELIMNKKKVIEQHEKGFNRVVRQVGFFAKDLDLGLSYLFKDMKDDVCLDEENITTDEEVVRSKVVMPLFRLPLFIFFFSSLLDFRCISLVIVTIFFFSF